jgi:hypothetical protein
MKKPEMPKQVLEYFRAQGKLGGERRAKTLSAEERIEIARKAVKARWEKSKEKNSSQKSKRNSK